jgi:anti-anti-sigma factor
MARRHVSVTPARGRCVARRDPDELDGLTVRLGFRDDSTWLSVAGELDLSTAPLLEAALRAHRPGAAGTTTGPLVLDLQDVSFIGARGIDVILAAAHQASRHGTRLRILPSRPVRRLAALLGVGDCG